MRGRVGTAAVAIAMVLAAGTARADTYDITYSGLPIAGGQVT